ncbi:MAG: signal peptidase I [Dongiaceae bacterium]
MPKWGVFGLSVLAIIGALFALAIVFRVSGFLGGPGYDLYGIPSRSMAPALRQGDYMFALTNVYGSELPRRGEIVVFKHPGDRKTDYDKRVIGLPGDRVQYRDGRLYLNGALVEREPLSAAEVEALNYPNEYGVPFFYWERLPNGARYVIAEDSDDGQLDNSDEIIVPSDSLFTLGDNRDNSADSRVGGFVPRDLLRARPLYIYWSRDRSRIGMALQPEN